MDTDTEETPLVSLSSFAEEVEAREEVDTEEEVEGEEEEGEDDTRRMRISNSAQGKNS